MILYTISDALAQVTENGIGLGSIFDKIKVDIDSYKNVIDDFKKLKLDKDIFKLEDGKANWDAIANAIEGCDETALSYFKTLDDGNGTINNQSASVEGLGEYLQSTGQSFNFAAIKATLLNTALNAGIFLAATVAVQALYKAFDNYIHRVENARERTSELFDEFKSMNNTLADHKKTVSELADRYDELSKGVNLSTNDNVSLSTEEYEEFLDINEQLAQSFPELAKGIDENGNSILTLGTNGITAKEELEELLQTEEDLNNFRIAQGLEDAFKGVYTYVEEANVATEKLNGTISDSSEAMSKLQDIAENGIKLTGENNQLIFAGNTNNQAELDYMYSLTASVNEFWKSLDGNRRVELGVHPSDLFVQNFDDTGAFEVYANLYNLTPEELTALENIIQDNVGDASGALLDSISDQSQELHEQIQKGENAWTDFIPALVSGMKSKQTFKNLDSNLQNIATHIVEGLDYSYATAMKEYDPDPYAYIRDKFIVPMDNLSDSDKQQLQSSFDQLLKLDADNLSKGNQAEIEKFITTIATLLEKDPLEIRVALGFDTEDIRNRYNEALKEAKRKLNGYGHDDRGLEVNNSIGDKIDDFWNKNVVTEEDWVLWKQVTDGITDATKAINAYTEAKKNANAVDVNETTISSFTDAWEQLKSSTDDATKDLSNTLTELAEQGRLTIDAFNDADSTHYFEGLNISADEAVQKINALVSSSTQLQSMSAQISKMSDMLADKKSGNAAKASDLAGFDAEVRGLDSWKEFESVMGSSKSTMEQCQKAANNLATEWINSGNYLSNLTEKNKDYYITALQNMGVENAEEIVKNALTLATQAQSAAEEFLAQKKRETSNETYSLIDATAEEITKFAEEKGYADNVTNALIELALKKQLVNGTTLDFSGDLANISNYVKALGGTANAIGLLNRIKKGEVYMPGDAMASVIASAQAEIDGAIAAGNKTNVQVNPVGSSGYKPSNPSDKGKNSETKDTKQTVDWIERKLSVLNDKISLTQSKFENLFNIKSPKNLSNKIKQTTKELQKAEKASSKWKNALGKIKISDSLKKDIQGGKKIDLSKYSKAEQKEIKKYQSAYKNYANAKKKENTLNDKLWGLQTSTGKDNNLKSQIKQYEALADAYDKAAEKYKKYADKVKLSSPLKKKVQTGDYHIADYSSETQKLIQEYEDLWKKYQDALKGKQESKQSANDKREERYQLYVDQAESKIAKSQAYAELDAGNYKKQNAHLKAQKGYIKESYKYQIKIAELNKDSVEAAKLKAELQKELNDLTMQEFDNIANTYDKQIGLNDNKIKAFQDQISLLEARGQKAGSALYSKQISLNNVNEKKLVAEREKLISKLSEIPKGTDDWYDAQDKLFGVESELVNIQTENANLQKSINQLKFDRFDDLIGKLNDVVDETNFLKDMLDSDHLFDDNGMITDDGLTAIGLTAQNYDTYLAEAEKYKQMQEDLEKMYANGEIGIADYESMRREYKQGQRDAIKSANDVRKAVIDYVKQGLDAQNEALSEAIDKQKELLRSEKDLYDFQQKIASQNKNIADLQKQINALEGDDSEENRKKLQQLKAELAEAEQEQKDTLYDRSISDQEDALDQMLKNSQEQAENYLKDSEKVFMDAFEYVNARTSQIANNIEAIAKETGYDISTYIVNAWKNSGDAVGNYSNALSSATPNILSQIDLITQKWNEQTTAIEKASQAAASLVTDSYLDYTRAGASGNSSSGRIEMSQKIEDFSDKKHTGNLVDADNLSRSNALTKGQIDAFLMLRNITPPTNIPEINIPSHVNTNIPVPNRTPMNINIDSSVHVEGVATDKIVQDMAGVAKKQAENVISEINRRTYAKGVRWR